jgi:hypothetical protein
MGYRSNENMSIAPKDPSKSKGLAEDRMSSAAEVAGEASPIPPRKNRTTVCNRCVIAATPPPFLVVDEDELPRYD